MPGIRIQGNAGAGRGANRTPGPSSFQSALLSGMTGGTDPFGGMSSADRQAMAGSPSYQGGSWQQPAQAELSRLLAQAVRDARSGTGNRQQSLQSVLHAANLLSSYGGMTPELESGLSAAKNLTGNSAGAMMPAPYISPSYAAGGRVAGGIPGTGTVAGNMSSATSVLDVLRSIDASNKRTVNLEQEQLAAIRQPPGAGPSGMGPPGTGPAGSFGSGGGATLPGGGGGAPAGPGFGPAGGGRRPPGGAPPGGGAAGRRGGGFRNIPFAARFGFGNTGSFLLGGGIGAGVMAAEELAFAPQILGNAEGRAVASAAPAYNLRMGAAGMGRAGGFAGSRLENALAPGLMPPDWMARTGMGPGEAMQLLQGFGITPGTSSQAEGITRGLGNMRLMPGLAGMSNASLSGSAGQAARLGMIQPLERDINTYSTQLSDIMTRAVAAGMDRASVLQSIDASVAASARGGSIGMTSQMAGRYLSQFGSLPGGRTGETGMQYAAGLREAGQAVGNDPATTIAFSSRVSGLKTEGDVKNLLDRTTPGAYEKIVSNPVAYQQLQQALHANSIGDSFSANKIFQDLLSPYTDTMSDIFTNNAVTNSFRGTPLGTVVTANMTRSDIGTTIQVGQSGTSQRIYNRFLTLGRSPAAAAAMAGAAIAESGGNPANGGYFQWRGDRAAAIRARYGKDPSQLTPEEAADFANSELMTNKRFAGINEKLNNLGNSPEEAVAGSKIVINGFEVPWDPSKGETENAPDAIADRSRAALAARNQFARGIPDSGAAPLGDAAPPSLSPTDSGARAAAQAGVYNGSYASLAEMNVLIPRLNDGLNQVINAAKTFAGKMEDAQKTMSFPMNGAPTSAATLGVQ